MSALAGAIERKARELGVWVTSGVGGPPHLIQGTRGFVLGTRDYDALELTPVLAALWLLVMEAGHTIEQACPACAERGGGWEWDYVWPAFEREGRERAGWRTASGWARHHGLYRETQVWLCSRPCPTCAVNGNPTGRIHTPAHEVMPGCKPVLTEPCCTGPFIECGCEGRVQEDWQGVRESRDAMAVLSDRLMDQGDPLGMLLALWLAGQLEERHVLGVERNMWRSTVGIAMPSKSDGWSFDRRDDTWMTGYHYTRPILEANP